MNKAIYLTSILLLLCGFDHQKAQDCKDIHQITKLFLKECAYPLHLRLEGRGGAMMGDIQKVSLHFECTSALTVDEARTLFVPLIGEYLKRINTNKHIRCYLHNFPFTEKNLEFSMGFSEPNNEYFGNNSVALMGLTKRQSIFYSGYDFENNNFFNLHREPYEEAIKIVMQKKDRCQSL